MDDQQTLADQVERIIFRHATKLSGQPAGTSYKYLYVHDGSLLMDEIRAAIEGREFPEIKQPWPPSAQLP